MLGTYALVNIAWVFFRARDFAGAFVLLRAMLGGWSAGLARHLVTSRWDLIGLTAVMLGLLAMHYRLRDTTLEEFWTQQPAWVRSTVLAGLVAGVVLFCQGNSRTFIYFQF
jgi:hypothetical protein